MFDLVIGLGQGGCRLAKTFSNDFKINGVYLNLSLVDFSKLGVSTFDTFVINVGGTGRNPIEGESIVRKHYSRLKEFIVNRINKRTDTYILVTVGGGGGSGSGFLFPLLDYLLKKDNRKVLLLYTIPMKNEGIPVKPNAVTILNRLINDYMNNYSNLSAMLIDNDYCYKLYNTGTNSKIGFWENINKNIVISLKRFWLMTNLENWKNYIDVTAGYKALDKADLRKSLFFGGGFIDILQANFSTLNINDISLSSLIFDNHKIKTSKRYIASLAMPDNWKGNKRTNNFIMGVFEETHKLIGGTPYFTRCSYFNKKITTSHLNIIVNGITESQGLISFIKGVEKELSILDKSSVKSLNLKKIIETPL